MILYLPQLALIGIALGLLGPELSQRLVIGLNGGVAYHLGKAVFKRISMLEFIRR